MDLSKNILQNKETKFPTPSSCKHFNTCGGCSLRNKNYSDQLEIKKKSILSAFQKYNLYDFKKNELKIVPSPDIDFYRNKMEFSFGSFERDIFLGLHKKGKYNDIVDLSECFMQSKKSNIILNICRSWLKENNLNVYNKKKNSGILRYLIIKHSKTNDDFLINLVTTENVDTSDLIKKLVLSEIDLRSFYLSINKNIADTAFTENTKLIFGDPFLEEKINNISYRIGPYSFFQVNTIQLEKMYSLVKNWLKKGDLLIDLYSGVGGFSLYLADIFKNVIGIEVNQNAIEAAQYNKSKNEIENCNFICGKVEDVLKDDILDITRDISMIVDPPRTGIGKKNIKNILTILPSKLVYVSCNPKTMASDIKNFEKIYDLIDIKSIDMFPNTDHIETIAYLKLKKNPHIFSYQTTNKKNRFNLFNISQFETDNTGVIINGNNTFYKFLKKITNQNKVNLIQLLTNKETLKKFDFKEGEYSNINRFFNGSFGSAIFSISNSKELFILELSFERDEKGIKGLLKDYAGDDKNTLEYLKTNIFFNLKDNIIITDSNWNIKYVNNNFVKQMACPFDEILNLSIYDIAYVLDFKKLRKKIETKLTEDKVWKGEFIIKNKLNKIFYYYTIVFFVNTDDENKFVFLMCDITDKFFLETNLITKNNQYNNLAQQIYHLNNIDLKEITENIETLKANKNKNYEDTNEIFETTLSLIEHSSNSLIEIKNKLRNLKNSCFVTTNLDNVNMSYYNFYDILNDEIAKLDKKLKEKNININSFYRTLAENIYLDKKLFKSMLSNLLENSINFTKQNGNIYIKVLQRNGFFNIHFINEEQQIHPEHSVKIFNDNLEDYDNKNLITCRKIAELHNGKIWLESPSYQIGKGTEFIVKIPIEKREYDRQNQ
jgi:23S rRNA (uracil-5-)-methyltransferase RumA